MSAVLGGSVGGETAPAGALLDPDVEGILEEKNQLISRQYAEIERLQRELAEVVGERDALLCEVSKFKFEREMTDLKRLHDDRYAQRTLAKELRFFPLILSSLDSSRALAALHSHLIAAGKKVETRIRTPRTFVFFVFLQFLPHFSLRDALFKRGKCNAVQIEKYGLDRDKNSFLPA
ncbi:hypothetical protein ALC56_11051 [Trachymyrmex septentrionalis]|uniref:Uncharacterized protein n=1 Tax=Trachymyrmex septentrionalis TaxID=34720 RepID=A0A195F271_9HYME|nr:hypothetical protein ALC56_11051 [Trachymyrmex septentrionalis]